MTFINALNMSAVTFISDVRAYGWAVADQNTPRPGYEVYSPFGEVKCFDTYAEANAWRIREVRAYVREYC